MPERDASFIFTEVLVNKEPGEEPLKGQKGLRKYDM